MIALSLSDAFLLYLGIAILFLLGLWLYQHFKKGPHKAIQPLHILFVCEYCHFVYQEESHLKVTQCPQCQSLNKNNPYKNKDN